MTKLSPDRWRQELKNQLGIVLGFADLLLHELEPNDPLRADIEEINTAAGRAMELIREGSAADGHES
jgi:hypothetical protein